MTSAKMAPVKIAVIGCGRIATSHLAAIRTQPDLGELVAVTDSDPQRARAAAERFGATALPGFKEVLDRVDVEAVVLCTPNALHSAQAIEALQAGKHVLVEKPMAEVAAEAEAMCAAAQRAQRVLAIAQSFRHSPSVRAMQDHWADFGSLLACEVSQCVFWDGPQAPWWATRTPEQGLILSLFAPHALDFVQLCMRDSPLRVSAEVARHQTRWQGEDEAMILLSYPRQRMASVHISYNQRHVVDRILLSFDRGVLRLEDGQLLTWNDTALMPATTSAGVAVRRMGARDFSDTFRAQMAEFALAVRGQPHRSVLHDEGRCLIELIDRVKRAARSNALAT